MDYGVRVETGAAGTRAAKGCDLGLERSFLRAHLLDTPLGWGKRASCQAEDGAACD